MRSFIAPIGALLILAPASMRAQVAPAPPPSPAMPRDLQQPQKTGSGRLAGRVTSAETGRPLRRAIVRTASPELREGRSVSTDADGRWEFKDLPAGRYSILVSKGGFVTIAYGQKRPFEQGKQVDLADGQAIEKLDVSLPKGSVITGRIMDEFGEPLSGARVAAMRHRFVQGGRRLVPAGSMGTVDMTDDMGQYRLHGLSPGDYYVSASMAGGFSMDVSSDRTGYTETYYPGTVSLQEAQRVHIGAGQETSEISFALTPTRVATISGTVTTSTGRPVANEMIMLSPANPGTVFGPQGMGRTRPDGSFTISNVAPGEYRLEARMSADSSAISSSGPIYAEAVSLPLTVSGRDIAGLAVVTAPTATMSGRVVFEGGVPPGFHPGALMVFSTPDTPTMSMFGGGQARVRDDWTFEAKGLAGRRLIRAVGAPGSWALKSVSLNDQDVTDSAIEFTPGDTVTGLEITLSQQMPSISGTVRTERDAAATDYVVVAFSPDTRKWGFQSRYLRSARPDQSGKFLIKSLPPDEYLLAAVEYLEPGEENDPELLENLRRVATPVTLADGETKNVNLKLSRSR